MKKDIYYNQFYGKLYEESEDATLVPYEFECEYGKVYHVFLKRFIDEFDGIKYFDIVTPYGYGGPLMIEYTDKASLEKAFNIDFSAYCKENHIVSEFIRFHPIYENALDFKEIYNVDYSRHTVGTNLFSFDDPVQSEFSKTLRKEIRKAERNGVKAILIKNPDNLDTFKKLYEETMDRNEADAYYYFDHSYYDYLVKYLGEYILEIQLEFEDEIIASEIYFVQGEYMHAHLLGSSNVMLDLNAGGLLEASAARWGHENGYKYIHHGGGRTSAEDDSLYLYKKKYGKHTLFDFYVGKKIWDQEMYDYLCQQKEKELNQELNTDYFPQYRVK